MATTGGLPLQILNTDSLRKSCMCRGDFALSPLHLGLDFHALRKSYQTQLRDFHTFHTSHPSHTSHTSHPSHTSDPSHTSHTSHTSHPYPATCDRNMRLQLI
ncbi:MAG: hypothetical protein F6J93_32945 [Oscillatoria sp. SIO1A7]|nr:hypothetical protein [Oscillatoria sp. SIO1A7]